MLFGIDVTANSVREAADLARLAERLKFSYFLLSDYIHSKSLPVTLTSVASVTRRIIIGPGIVSPYLRHPALIAQLLATLYELAPGRLICGVGAGDRNALSQLGVRMDSPLARVREAVELIRSFLASWIRPFAGRTSGGEGGYNIMRTIPLLVGAQGPKMIELAGKIGDGVLLNTSSPAYVGTSRKIVGELPEGYRFAVCSPLAIGNDEKVTGKARRVAATIIAGASRSYLASQEIDYEVSRAVRAHIQNGQYGEAAGKITDSMLSKLLITGSVDECVERIAAMKKEEVDIMIFAPPFGAEPIATLRRLASRLKIETL